jgi:lipoprotein-anchoring transpeptidase ErfK/SrfK
MRLRDCVSLGALVCAGLAGLSPARADKISFSPSAFQVYGGMSDAREAAPSSPSFLESLFMPKQSLQHQTVAFASTLPPGSIDIRTGERRLYYILGNGQAILYHVGVGREGFAWSGTNRVSRKAEWPDWRPPQEMIVREAARGHDIPDLVPGGIDNPLGARAIYIGDTEYRIHGTTEPWSIGQAMSSGCIRMMNEEVIDLYNRVAIGALVVVE